MPDHSSHLALIRQLRDLGAVKVSVGDLHVEFGGPPAVQEDPHSEPPEESEEEQRRQWERIQYFSSRG